MRYEIKGLEDLVEFIDELDEGDRLSFHLDNGDIYCFRFNDKSIRHHEIVKKAQEDSK